MPTRIYLASSNKGKLRELAALAEPEGIELAPLSDYDQLPRAREDDSSFALNALEKALHYSRRRDGLIVADDSGLVVDALGGAPGVRSARYAGPAATDEANNRKLLEDLRGVPEDRRTARYLCVLVLARERRPLAIISDSCAGRILEAPRGHRGFGYDPLFFFPPLGKTMAELPLAEKNQHSHRGKAFRKLLAYLRDRAPAS
ncbi:MAG: RdgB/HAM1 family non-canonical purine NTP pyrophosphatase [Terriglobia bacterium]